MEENSDLDIGSNFHFFLLIFVAQASAATHPNLVVSQSDVPQIQARIQAKAATADAFNRMKSQSWYPGAPGWAQEEGWSRKLVEQSFVGLVDNDSQAINQAKANF